MKSEREKSGEMADMAAAAMRIAEATTIIRDKGRKVLGREHRDWNKLAIRKLDEAVAVFTGKRGKEMLLATTLIRCGDLLCKVPGKENVVWVLEHYEQAMAILEHLGEREMLERVKKNRAVLEKKG